MINPLWTMAGEAAIALAFLAWAFISEVRCAAERRRNALLRAEIARLKRTLRDSA